MKKKKVCIVGNGVASPLEASEFDDIYVANSAINRVDQPEECVHLISEGLLHNRQELSTNPPQPNRTIEESVECWLSRGEVLKDLSVKECIVPTGHIKIDVEQRLAEKNYVYGSFKTITHTDKNRLIKEVMGRLYLFGQLGRNFSIKNLLSLIKSELFDGNLPFDMKPSTGICGLLTAIQRNGHDATYELSGINVNAGIYHYPGGVHNIGRGHSFDSVCIARLSQNFDIVYRKEVE